MAAGKADRTLPIGHSGLHEGLRVQRGHCHIDRFLRQFHPPAHGLFFTAAPRVTSFAQATTCDTERFKRFFHAMLDAGVYLAPSAYEAGFLSLAHDDAIIDETLAAASAAFRKI